jgi:hypothetical protein
MVQKELRHPRRTNQEWLDLIQECRASGMSDKDWCDQHNIQRSSFYYHIRKLRDRACAIPEALDLCQCFGHKKLNIFSLHDINT